MALLTGSHEPWHDPELRELSAIQKMTKVHRLSACRSALPPLEQPRIPLHRPPPFYAEHAFPSTGRTFTAVPDASHRAGVASRARHHHAARTDDQHRRPAERAPPNYCTSRPRRARMLCGASGPLACAIAPTYIICIIHSSSLHSRAGSWTLLPVLSNFFWNCHPSIPLLKLQGGYAAVVMRRSCNSTSKVTSNMPADSTCPQTLYMPS